MFVFISSSLKHTRIITIIYSDIIYQENHLYIFLFFHIIAKFHFLAVMWFHLIIRYCIFCNEFQKLISVSILLLKVYKNKIYSIFLLQLHKAEEAKWHHSQYHTSGHSRRPTSWCSCRASRSSGTWPLTQSCNVRDSSMQG